MNIFIDMDQTLNWFWLSYVEALSNLTNKGYFISREELTTYKIYECLNISKEKGIILENQIMGNDKFWLNIPVYQGAIQALQELSKKHNIYILSAPWMNYLDCIKCKILWMKEYFPFIKPENLIFTMHKKFINGDILIDDSPTFLEGFKGKKIVIDYPYNRHLNYDFRSQNWNKIVEWINKE